MAKTNKVGRPTKMTEVVLGKLEQAFSLDATIDEACFYAGINPDTFYDYQKKNPKYSERVKALRKSPLYAARKKVVDDIKSDVNTAKWYLERKLKGEFSVRQEVTGEDGQDIKFLVTRGYGNENSQHVLPDQTTSKAD